MNVYLDFIHKYYGFLHVTLRDAVSWFVSCADRLLKLAHKKSHAMNPAFVRWAKNDFYHEHGHIPTSGFVGVVMLMHVCRKVSLFGFDLDLELGPEGSGRTMLKRWYYDKRDITLKDRRRALSF